MSALEATARESTTADAASTFDGEDENQIVLIWDELCKYLNAAEQLEVKRVLGWTLLERNEELRREAQSLNDILREATDRQMDLASRSLLSSRRPSAAVPGADFERSVLQQQIAYFVERIRRASASGSAQATAVSEPSSGSISSIAPPPLAVPGSVPTPMAGAMAGAMAARRHSSRPSTPGSRPASRSTVGSLPITIGGSPRPRTAASTGSAGSGSGRYSVALEVVAEVLAEGAAAASSSSRSNSNSNSKEAEADEDGEGEGEGGVVREPSLSGLWQQDGDREHRRLLDKLRAALVAEREWLLRECAGLQRGIQQALGDDTPCLPSATTVTATAAAATTDVSEDVEVEVDVAALRAMKQQLQRTWLSLEAAEGSGSSGAATAIAAPVQHTPVVMHTGGGGGGGGSGGGGSSRVAARLQAARNASATLLSGNTNSSAHGGAGKPAVAAASVKASTAAPAPAPAPAAAVTWAEDEERFWS